MIALIMDQIKFSKSSPDTKDSPKDQDPVNVVPAKKEDPPLEGGNSKKMVECVISNIRSAHKNCMKYSSRQDSKATLIWTSINSINTSICVSMRWLHSERPSSWSLVHQKTLLVWIILCPRSWSPFLFLESTDLHFTWTLTAGGIE